MSERLLKCARRLSCRPSSPSCASLVVLKTAGILLGCAALIALGGGPVDAQSTAQLRERALRFIALQTAAESLDARARRVDSALFAPTDTLRAGGLRLRFAPLHRSVADSAARIVFRSMPPDLRASLDDALVDALFVMHRPGDLVAPPRDATNGRDIGYIPVDTSTGAARLAGVLGERIGAVLGSRLDDGARRWIGGWLPTRVLTRDDRKVVYRSLSTSPSRLGRDCVAGVQDTCGKALRILAVRDTVAEWYDASDRREVVRRHLESGVISNAGTREVESCLRGDDARCDQTLRATS